VDLSSNCGVRNVGTHRSCSVIGILMRAVSYRFYAYINSFLETAI
jgi:hypothetical protein